MSNLNFGMNILPKANNTYTLGSNEYKWNIFANQINGVNVSSIINGGSGGSSVDVQMNNTSIVNNGVANFTTSYVYGIGFNGGSNLLYVSTADDAGIKSGTMEYRCVSPMRQHQSVFYGLAKAAGDTTQASSSNAVGTYTNEAKAAIQSMLGIDLSSIASQVSIPLVETVSGTTPSIIGQPNVRYVCGEISTLSITPPSVGSMDVIFESGSTATVLTVPSTVKWPVWFNSEALEANMTYEILITDGVYGSVMAWET